MVLRSSGALELNVVLHTIVDSARKLVDARYAAVGVLDEADEFRTEHLRVPRRPVPPRRGNELPRAPGCSASWSATRSRCGWRTWRPIPVPPASPRITQS